MQKSNGIVKNKVFGHVNQENEVQESERRKNKNCLLTLF